MSPGGHCWDYCPGTLSPQSDHCNYPFFNRVAVIWLERQGTRIVVLVTATMATCPIDLWWLGVWFNIRYDVSPQSSRKISEALQNPIESFKSHWMLHLSTSAFKSSGKIQSDVDISTSNLADLRLHEMFGRDFVCGYRIDSQDTCQYFTELQENQKDLVFVVRPLWPLWPRLLTEITRD